MQWLLNAVLNWALGKLTEWIGGLARFFKWSKAIDEQKEQDVVPLKKAETADEIDKATDDALRHL